MNAALGLKQKDMERIEDSPLLTRIKNKLDDLEGNACEVKISITPEAEQFEAENGDQSFVKWLNWQLYDEKSSLLFQSDLCIVHGELKESTLQEDLSKFFPKQASSIDNEIYFED